MLKIIHHDELGHANLGWLDAHYHFSFAHYLNRDRMGFGPIRVINDDIIQPGKGFDLHEHKDMEIITYVRSGAIHHGDNLGNKGVTKAGDVQVMSAGSGIYHSEASDPNEPTTLYQIWIRPQEMGITPRWEQGEMPKEPVGDQLNLLVSGFESDKEKGALYIHQQAAIYGGKLKAGQKIEQTFPTESLYILISEGSLHINNSAVMHKGDGAEVTGNRHLHIVAETDCEILVISV